MLTVRLNSDQLTWGRAFALAGSSRSTLFFRIWDSLSLKKRIFMNDTGSSGDLGNMTRKAMPVSTVYMPSSYRVVSICFGLEGMCYLL